MAVKDKSSGKQVRDIKAQEPVNPTIEINPGNVSILTVKILDQINQNLLKLIKLAEQDG